MINMHLVCKYLFDLNIDEAKQCGSTNDWFPVYKEKRSDFPICVLIELKQCYALSYDFVIDQFYRKKLDFVWNLHIPHWIWALNEMVNESRTEISFQSDKYWISHVECDSSKLLWEIKWIDIIYRV